MSSRHHRRFRLNESADHILERRELMAAEILRDVNIAPSATLLFDTGPTQFYLQGESLVAVEGSAKVVLETDLNLGLYGYHTTFRQAGDVTLFFGRSALADQLLAYRYEHGAGQAELIRTWNVDRWYRFESEKLVQSGDELILVGDPEAPFGPAAAFRFDGTVRDFVPISSPVPGGSIVDVDPLGGGSFLVVAELAGKSTGYAYDPVSTTFEPLTAEKAGSQKQATILSNTIESQTLFAFAGGLYVTDGTAEGSRSIPLDPDETLGSKFEVVTFGSSMFIGTSSSGFMNTSYSILRLDADFQDVTLVGASQPGQFDGFGRLSVRLAAAENRLAAFATWDDFESPVTFVSNYDPDSDLFSSADVLPAAIESIHATADGEMLLFTETNWNEGNGAWPNFSVYKTTATAPAFVDKFAGVLISVIPFGDKLLTMVDHDDYVTIGSFDGTSDEFEELKAIEQRLAHLGYLEPGDGYYAITPQGLVFQAGDAAHGVEPWITDGTVSGTKLLADVVPGPGSSYAQAFRSVSGVVDFVARGPDEANRTFRYLWNDQEPVDGVELLAETNGSSGYVGLGSNENSQVPLGGLILFTAFDGNSLALFASDGTPGGTTVLADRLLFQELTTASGKALFLRLATNATELWATDGTSGGTSLVKVFAGQALQFNANSENADASRTYASFWTKSATTGLLEIWISDGTTGGTRLATTLSPDAILPYQWELPVTLGDKLVFMVRPKSEEPWSLIALDIETGESVTLTTSESELQSYGKIENGLLYFESFPSDPFGKVLFSTDGTIAGTGPVALSEGLTGSPVFVTRRGLLVAKSGAGSEDAVDLHFDWNSTGELQPFRVSDHAGAGTISTWAFQEGAFVQGRFLYFFYEKTAEETSYVELWRTDGTGAGTQLVISPQSGGPQIDFAHLTDAGDASVLFVSDNAQSKYHRYLLSGDELPIVLNAGLFAAMDIIGVVGNRLLVHQDIGSKGMEPHFYRIGNALPPEIAPIDPLTIDENSPWTYQVVATGAAYPIRFSLLPGAPAGMTIDPETGLITWTPAEHQGGLAYPLSVRAESVDDPSLAAETSFILTVEEDNQTPVLGGIPNFVISEHQEWSCQAMATDADLPAPTLVYGFEGNVPAGMTIDPATGLIRWKPGETQGGMTVAVRVTVSDGGTNPSTGSGTFNITVLETNEAPVIAPIADKIVDEGQTLEFMVKATDADSPGQALTYSLVGSVPAGATIDPATGLFRWQPPFGATSQRIDVLVRDTGSPAKEALASFQVIVKPVTLQITRTDPIVNRQNAITGMTIRFSQQVDLASSRRLTNYRLVNAGRDGRFGTRDDRTIRVLALRVAADRRSIVLTPQGSLARNQSYRLTVLDTVLDTLGRRLDGDRNGTFGGTATIDIVRGVIN